MKPWTARQKIMAVIEVLVAHMTLASVKPAADTLTHLSQLAAPIDNFRGSQVQKSESDQWSELWNRL